jgi:hypothetical protein
MRCMAHRWEADQQMPSDPGSKTRVRLAFLLLFVVLVVGAYFANELMRLPENIAARESHAALQGITDAGQIDEALKQHPQNGPLRLLAAATKAANDTNAAIEKLSNEMAPPSIAKQGTLGGVGRSELEALRRDLKTAQANAATFMPRYLAVLKAERETVEKNARSVNVGTNTVSKILDNVDKRHAEIAAFTAKMLAARGDFYRADENYIAFFITEFGAYKVVNGQLIFPFQPTVDRYNAAADAMTTAANRVAAQEDERKSLEKAQQERWMQFIRGQ